MRSFYFPCASVFEVATLVHSCCLDCTSVTEQGWNIGPWKILLYCQNKWENVSKPPITYNRLQKAKQNHARKRLLRTKWRKEREGYTFSLPASTKITKKKNLYWEYTDVRLQQPSNHLPWTVPGRRRFVWETMGCGSVTQIEAVELFHQLRPPFFEEI